MTEAGRAKFDAAMSECRLHAAVLAEARGGLPMAFAAPDVAVLGSEQRRLLDQSAFRFMKLQDSLGEKVLPGILTLTLEPLPPRPRSPRLITGVGELLQLWSGVERYCHEHLG